MTHTQVRALSRLETHIDEFEAEDGTPAEHLHDLYQAIEERQRDNRTRGHMLQYAIASKYMSAFRLTSNVNDRMNQLKERMIRVGKLTPQI